MSARRLGIWGARAFSSLPPACCRRSQAPVVTSALGIFKIHRAHFFFEDVRQHAGHSGQHARAPQFVRVHHIR